METASVILHMWMILQLSLIHIQFKEAIITRGGVSVKEINPGTMEVKKISGLYFAGEVLDLDAVTGGYNLQIAWSTAYLAAQAIQLSLIHIQEQDEDVLTYALFPQVAMDFFKYRQAQKTKVDEKAADKKNGAYPV